MSTIETEHRLRMARVGAQLTMQMANRGIAVMDAGDKAGLTTGKVLSIVTGQPDVTILDVASFAAAIGCRVDINIASAEPPPAHTGSTAANPPTSEPVAEHETPPSTSTSSSRTATLLGVPITPANLSVLRDRMAAEQG